MSQLEVERFLGRLLTDADFRARAADSLPAACYKEGIVVSEVEMSLLSRIDLARFDGFAEFLDPSIRRS